MAIDSRIALGYQPTQVDSPLNQLAQVMQVRGLQNQNALAQYGLAKAQRTDDETNAFAQLLRSQKIDLSTPEGQAQAFQAAPTVAPAMIKNYMEGRKMTSEIDKNNAEAGAKVSDVAVKKVAQYRDAAQFIKDPQTAAQFVQTMAADPALKGTPFGNLPVDRAVASIPQDPAGLQRWLQEFSLGSAKFIELNKPHTQVVNTGGAQQVIQTPGLGGAPTMVGTMQNTNSPDAVLQSKTSLATNAATNATSRANNSATIQKDLLVAGMNPDGGVNQNVEQMAQAIAKGQAAPITGFALAKPQGQTVMRRVFEINPTYDETTYSAKNAAAKAFTSGQQGNALRSVATANAHLDQMGELVDALNNGNIQLINKVANAYQQQTGNPAPTNFDAVKNVIGQEVVKAIVAGGGGVGEREEAAKAFQSANSPAQLKGVIQHYRMVMGAQQDNLLDQRRAAGLTDDTLPAYSRPKGKGVGGLNIDPSAIDAELARRAGKK